MIMIGETAMKNRLQSSMKILAFLCLTASACQFAFARPARVGEAYKKTSTAKQGILLLAHGGKQTWNDEVNKLAASVDKTTATEVAFGMATKRNIQSAINRLVARGVTEIVAVPLFISSHSSVITSTQYLLGLRKEAPPELAIFAKMDHSHGAHQHTAGHSAETAFDPTTPVKSPVPIRMTAALDRHPIVADILLSRARSISQKPQDEVVIVVAHGPVTEQDNAKWLADMEALIERLKKESRFTRVDYMTVRDDAPEPIRSKATAELRGLVTRAAQEGKKVLIVPLLLSYGGIEEGLKKRLEGLNYTLTQQALLPDERLALWVMEARKKAAEK
jgi:sirohydrochlorin ferrochelatase